jgi:hypothetical protein
LKSPREEILDVYAEGSFDDVKNEKPRDELLNVRTLVENDKDINTKP